MKPQTADVLTHLKQHGTITPLESLYGYGIMRLGARVLELRRAGYVITTEREVSGEKSYARYRITIKPGVTG